MEPGKKHLCRLCLHDGECLIYIFKEHPGEMYVPAEVIKDLLHIQVSKEDGYPSFLCLRCFEKLTDICQFKKQCLESIVAYDKLLSSKAHHQKGTKVTKVPSLAEKHGAGWTENCKRSYELSTAGSVVCEEEPPWDDPPEDPLVIVKEELDDEMNEGESEEYRFRGNESESRGILEEVKSECVDEDSEEHSQYQLGGIGSEYGLEEAKSECVDEDSDEYSQHPLAVVTLELSEVNREDEPNEIPTLAKKEEANWLGHYGYSYEANGAVPDVCGEDPLRENPSEDPEHRSRGRRHWCPVCIKSFSRKEHLDRHYRCHIGEKMYSCDQCGKAFFRKDKMMAHQRTHETGKYSCETCGKLFTRRDHLGKHLILHTKVEVHACEVCASTFPKRNLLLKHWKTHKIAGPYVCVTCGKSYIRKTCYLKHQNLHAPANDPSTGRPFVCATCGEIFRDVSDLLVHQVCHKRKRRMASARVDAEQSSPVIPGSTEGVAANPMAPVSTATAPRVQLSSITSLR